MAENKEKLFDQFPPVSTAEWKAKVEADLKGAPFDKKLVWRTNEGFDLQPMYRAEDIEGFNTTDSLPGEYPYIRGTRNDNDWLTRQEIDASDVKAANAKALDILTKGVNSLGFKGVSPDYDAVAALLEGIDITAVEINFHGCPRSAEPLAQALVKYIKEKGAENTFRGSIGFNPLKKALKHGKPFPGNIADMAKNLVSATADIPGLKVLAVDSVMLSDAGAYIFQELGYALAWGAEWMTILTDAGVDANLAASKIKFNMGISSNYFMELAKFRAARMLWAQIACKYGVSEAAAKMAVHASTSRFNQTIYDAHVNLLRSQTECMSAALAGVDSITVTPFDAPYQTPDDFSERIARNQQFLLKEESHLDKVVDPAGGSYYVETLTVSIANEAWKLFLATEEKGGFVACVNNGTVQAVVRETSEKRHTDVARRKEILLGTNQYPNINETAAAKIKTTGCHCSCSHEDEDSANALPATRAASDFEALRLARAQFSTNFFGCAGYEIIDNLGFDTVEQGVDAALAKGADVVVLCSSDDEYAELAPAAYKYLDGRAEFVVAGAPACTEELKAVGIVNYVNVRSNVLDTLRAFNAKFLK